MKKEILTPQLLSILEEWAVVEQVRKIGGSYALILPKDWVETFCFRITDENGEETYWVRPEAGVEDNDKGYIKYSYPDKDEIIDRLIKYLPTSKRRTGEMAFSDEEIIEICKEMLRTRNLHLPPDEE